MMIGVNKELVGTIPASYLLLLTILVCFFMNAVRAGPVERAVGAKVGDTVKYGEFSVSWYSNNPNATIPQDLSDKNNTLWVINTVLDVSETTVIYQGLTHYENGTEKSHIAEVDVKTGNGNGTFAFVSAGLTAGDSVYASAELSDIRINYTIPRAYLGLTRETNLLNVTARSCLFKCTTLQSEYYWDKETGALVEQSWSFTEIDEYSYMTTASVDYRMVDNNIWIGTSDDVPPVADAGPDQTVELGERVALDASGSRDNVGISSFQWDFGDGTTGVGIETTHTYGDAGTYDVTLTVEDAKGNSAKDTVAITVKDSSSPQLPTSFIIVIVFAALMFTLWILLRRR